MRANHLVFRQTHRPKLAEADILSYNSETADGILDADSMFKEAAVVQGDAAADSVAEVDVPGSGTKVEKRRDTIQAAYDPLRAEGVSTEQLREEAWDVDSETYESPVRCGITRSGPRWPTFRGRTRGGGRRVAFVELLRRRGDDVSE